MDVAYRSLFFDFMKPARDIHLKKLVQIFTPCTFRPTGISNGQFCEALPRKTAYILYDSGNEMTGGLKKLGTIHPICSTSGWSYHSERLAFKIFRLIEFEWYNVRVAILAYIFIIVQQKNLRATGHSLYLGWVQSSRSC